MLSVHQVLMYSRSQDIRSQDLVYSFKTGGILVSVRLPFTDSTWRNVSP